MKSLKNLVSFKNMLTMIGLIYICAGAGRKAYLSKELKFERIFFPSFLVAITILNCLYSRKSF